MEYDLVTVELKPARTIFVQATDSHVLKWLVSTLDDVYPYSIKDKLTVEYPSGDVFRYGITCRDARMAVFYLVGALCRDGWQPIGCSTNNTWVTGGFFQRERDVQEG